jgi:cobalamin synthase
MADPALGVAGLLVLPICVSGNALSLGSWYAGRGLVALLVPLALAAWALWVIFSVQRRPSAESAT